MTQFSQTKVVFLNVGQGDAILISKGARQILIDGGRDSTVLLEQLGKYMPFWDRTIDIVVATHPDADHIDGLVGVFDNYKVEQFWHTNASKDTSVYQKLVQSVRDEQGTQDIIVFYGLRGVIDDSVNLEVIYPFVDDVNAIDDVNETSIVILLHVDDKVFYFGGDLPIEKEDLLPLGHIDVLKAGHHGSHSSTSKYFLQKTKPKNVIISVGKNNHYGHPHKDTLERIRESGAQIFRTDEVGAIIYTCDKNCSIDFE
jgi:competence protein ComEC